MAKVNLRSVFPSLPKTERGKAIVLGADPKGETFLYSNGNNIFIRDINNAAKCDIYSEHTTSCTVAAYSPSRFYIASGDASGKVRIWDTVNPEHVLKNEFHVLGGGVRDISWASDNTKLAVVGEGKQLCAKVITADSGNTVGDLSGHNGTVNSVSYKATRPFRLVTAGEDMRTQFYEGPPFKYKQQNMEHTNFVNCVRFSPKGEFYITGGADGKAYVYDGTTSDQLGTLGDKAHNGGIYALEFSADGKEVLTVSGDKSAKIWNVADPKNAQEVVTFSFGNQISDMMVGCLWSGNNLITVSLDGFISFLDRNNPSTPSKVLKGHNKPVTALALSPDRSTIYSSGLEAVSASKDKVNANIYILSVLICHTNQVLEMVAVGDSLISVSMDDTIRFTSLSSRQYGSEACKLPSQPRAVAALPSGVAVVCCESHIAVVEKGNIMFQQQVKFGPTCVGIHSDGSTVAFGGQSDLHIFELSGTALKGVRVIKTEDDVMRVKFSPDGAMLAVCTGSKRWTYVYDISDDYKQMFRNTKQTGKIFSLDWSPNSQYYATGSLDGSLAVWCLDTAFNKQLLCLKGDAHKKSSVSQLLWLGDNTLVTASSDCSIKLWNLVQ
ncbi:hypothetical protein DPMN_067176 [Dreissena polymorpha]|uniref:Actin-interacting protein 1 n=1 Tax=Dreissena polymorpha TaxID=45954 RepID=A0A9D4BL51_DREPO|nr:hypothetical protein DPMN_067176 [Dreissena polymorpha]